MISGVVGTMSDSGYRMRGPYPKSWCGDGVVQEITQLVLCV